MDLIKIFFITSLIFGFSKSNALTAEEEIQNYQKIRDNGTYYTYQQTSPFSQIIINEQTRMTIGNHRDVLDKSILGNTPYQEQLWSALWHQDTIGQVNSAAHFDNCNFEGALNYIDSLIQEIDEEQKTQTNLVELRKFSFYRIGKAAHAIQDFYAHTNYIEMNAINTKIITPDDIKIIPVWTPEGEKQIATLQKNGLVSGYFFLGTPNRCPSGAVSHKELAKDNEKTQSGSQYIDKFGKNQFQVTKYLASKATNDFFSFGYQRWPKLRPAFSKIEYSVLDHSETANK